MTSRILAVAFGGLLASTAHAEVVVFDYTAVVTGLIENFGEPVDSFMVDGTTIKAGYTFSGSFTIDLATPGYDNHPDSPSRGYFAQYRGSFGNVADMTVAETGYRFDSRPASYYGSGFEVGNSPEGDSFFYESGNLIYSGAHYRSEYVMFNLSDPSGQMLDSVGAPRQLSIPEDGSATMRYYLSLSEAGKYWTASANLTSLRLHTSPVPEPSTWAMLGLGLAAVGAAARRRRA